MKVVAIKDMSAGNETVGEMWQETKIFNLETPIIEIIAWAKDESVDFTKNHSSILKKRLQINLSKEEGES